MQPILRSLSTAGGLALVAGCHYETTATDNGMIVHWSDAMLAVSTYGPIACLGAGLLILKSQRMRLLGMILIFAGIIGVPMGAGFLTDKVTITDREITQRYGFFWDRHERGFAFENVEHLEIYEVEQEFSASRGDMQRWFICFGDHDLDRSIYPDSLWIRATDDILEKLKEHGIECIRRPER